MKAVLCWLALGAFPALGQPGGGPVAPFAIYATFQHEPPAPVLNSLREELTSIMSAAGMQFEWRSWDLRDGTVSYGLAVINFKGRCDTEGLVHDHAEMGALGWTYVTDGQILPFSDVDCDRVRGFLAKALMHQEGDGREPAFGRAVARVLAHELYHIVTQTRHHGGSGVAQATYTVSDLLAGKFSFAESDRRVLGGRLATFLPHLARKMPPAKARSLFARSCGQCHGSHATGSPAPSLRAAGRPLNARELAARLADKRSSMYRQAQQLGTFWPALAKPDIEDLVTYLNASLE